MAFHRLRVLVLLAVAAGTVGLATADDDPPVPAVAYTLIINGERHEIVPDEPLKITGTLENPTVTLQVSKHRTFQAAGVGFEYPAYFTFEAETADPDVQTWTVSGNDVTVILFRFAERVSPADLAKSTADALEAKVTESQPLKLKLGEKDHFGVKTTISFASQALIQQTVSLPAGDKGSRILVIQEVRADNAAAAAEVPAIIKLLGSTLVIEP